MNAGKGKPSLKGSDFYCLRQSRAVLLNLQYLLNTSFLVVLFKLCVKSLWGFILYKKALLLISPSLRNWRVQCRMTTGAISLAENSYCFYCIILDSMLWKTWLKWEKKAKLCFYEKQHFIVWLPVPSVINLSIELAVFRSRWKSLRIWRLQMLQSPILGMYGHRSLKKKVLTEA